MAQPARVIRFSDYPVAPWKNGLGVTREIVSVGARADGTFGWRLSMAEISVDAPFSVFPGIERHLAVVAGGPLELVVAGLAKRIEIGGAVTTFAGDAAVSARPLDRAVTDLNLMVDRSAWSGSLETVSTTTRVHTAGISAVVSIHDGLHVHATDRAGSVFDYELDALDCLLTEDAAELSLDQTALPTTSESVAVVVRVTPAPA